MNNVTNGHKEEWLKEEMEMTRESIKHKEELKKQAEEEGRKEDSQILTKDIELDHEQFAKAQAELKQLRAEDKQWGLDHLPLPKKELQISR